MKHIGALVGITVLVFGTFFLFTFDWPFNQSADETAAVSEPAPLPEPEAPPAQTEAPPVSEELLAQGEQHYRICQACHGPAGEGSVGPAFAGNADLADAGLVVQTILFGREMMPPFGEQFDDEEIAAVATFIRNSWGNAFGGVAPEDVATLRESGPAEE